MASLLKHPRSRYCSLPFLTLIIFAFLFIKAILHTAKDISKPLSYSGSRIRSFQSHRSLFPLFRRAGLPNSRKRVQIIMLQVEIRTGRSISTRLLHTVMRNFKWLLFKAQADQPAGSPQLEVPSAASKSCSVTERNVDDTWLYDLVPKDEQTAEKAKSRRIY